MIRRSANHINVSPLSQPAKLVYKYTKGILPFCATHYNQ